MNRETKKRIKNYIEDKILTDKLFDVTVHQKRPYTCVIATIYYNDKEYIDIGFSKVMWTDEWDKERGVVIATKRAIRQFACDFVNGIYAKNIAQKKRQIEYLEALASKLEIEFTIEAKETK